MGMASGRSPSFPAQYLAGHLLPLPTAERCAGAPSPEGAGLHFAQPRSVQEAEARRALGSQRRAPAQRHAAGQAEVAPS